MSPVVDVRGLTVTFGPVVAVDGVDLAIPAGASVALVGRNGAGKSTTLRALACVLPPTSGSVRIAGVDAARDPSTAKSMLGYCPDVGGLIPRATAWEHLQLAATLRGMPAGWEERATDLLDRFELGGVADRVTSTLQPRHGPADVRRPRRLPLPARPAARRALRRGRPARRRRDHGGHPRAAARPARPSWSPPTCSTSRSRPARRRWCSGTGRSWPPHPPPSWPGRTVRRATGRTSHEVAPRD